LNGRVKFRCRLGKIGADKRKNSTGHENYLIGGLHHQKNERTERYGRTKDGHLGGRRRRCLDNIKEKIERTRTEWKRDLSKLEFCTVRTMMVLNACMQTQQLSFIRREKTEKRKRLRVTGGSCRKRKKKASKDENVGAPFCLIGMGLTC